MIVTKVLKLMKMLCLMESLSSDLVVLKGILYVRVVI